MTHRVVLRRLLEIVPTVIGILLIGFLLIHLAPGDPVTALAGAHGDEAYYTFMRQRFGLDQPLPRQFVTWMQRVAVGDLGTSYVYGRSAAAVIAERVPATLLLTGTALLVAIVGAIPIGAMAAQRPHAARDVTVSGVALTLYSAPVFWIGQLAILLVALHWGLLPVQGMTTAGASATGLAHVVDVGRHLILPALVLASHEMAVLVRVTRAGVVEEMTRDHVRTARAKGVSERAVLFRHALPRALLPVITVIGTRAGHLLSGAVVVEIVFGWPGMGRLLLAALQARDVPVILALFMLTSLSVVFVNLATDLLYTSRDPRLRLR